VRQRTDRLSFTAHNRDCRTTNAKWQLLKITQSTVLLSVSSFCSLQHRRVRLSETREVSIINNDGFDAPPIDYIRLQCDEEGELLLDLDGQCTKLKPPRRALPLSDSNNFIVLYVGEGKELFMLDSLAELDEASRVVLFEALEQAYRLERITRILEVDKDPLSGQTRWRAELAVQPKARTQCHRAENGKLGALNGHAKGIELTGGDVPGSGGKHGTAETANVGTGKVEEREFCVNGQEDVQTARYPHIFITDTERRRYEIPNCDNLDQASRRAAEVFF
jgi:hypothetical protein